LQVAEDRVEHLAQRGAGDPEHVVGVRGDDRAVVALAAGDERGEGGRVGATSSPR